MFFSIFFSSISIINFCIKSSIYTKNHDYIYDGFSHDYAIWDCNFGSYYWKGDEQSHEVLSQIMILAINVIVTLGVHFRLAKLAHLQFWRKIAILVLASIQAVVMTMTYISFCKLNGKVVGLPLFVVVMENLCGYH